MAKLIVPRKRLRRKFLVWLLEKERHETEGRHRTHTWWQGKLFVLVLLGFVATDFIITDVGSNRSNSCGFYL